MGGGEVARQEAEGLPAVEAKWEAMLAAQEVVTLAEWPVVCEMPTGGGSGRGSMNCRSRRSEGKGSIRGLVECLEATQEKARAEAEQRWPPQAAESGALSSRPAWPRYNSALESFDSRRLAAETVTLLCPLRAQAASRETCSGR